jgi:hypothetical protein
MQALVRIRAYCSQTWWWRFPLRTSPLRQRVLARVYIALQSLLSCREYPLKTHVVLSAHVCSFSITTL